MIAEEKSIPLPPFKGLNKALPHGDMSGYTRSLDNVTVRHGQVTGRGGITFDTNFSAVMTEEIVGLHPFTAEGGAVTLLRIGPTKVEKSTGGAWTDVTGTALTGTAADRPQATMHKGVLIFTNEGQDRPRKWTGSGNTAVLGGTPPFAKALVSYLDFLILLNYSSAGSIFLPRGGIYSNDYDVDWDLCEGNTLEFNETSGDILAAGVVGRHVKIMKSDGIISLVRSGGATRFAQDKMNFDKGIIAPLSFQLFGGERADAGGIFLASDYELYVVTESSVTPLPPNVNKVLQSTLLKSAAGNCRSAISHEDETYSLFYPIDTNNRGRILYNYRTGEFSHHTYSTNHRFTAIASFKFSSTVAETLVGATDNERAYTLDSLTDKVDNITDSTSSSVSRYYDLDWQAVDALFTGVTLIFEKLPLGRCSVSFALDHENNFKYEKHYDLKATRTGDEYVSVRYDVPPTYARHVNVRIKFFPSATAEPILTSGFMHFVPTQGKKEIHRGASLSTTVT